MKIVFDLDYTLLDTVAFKQALVDAVCVEGGPTPDAYERAYEETVKEKGLFVPEALFEKLIPDDEAARSEARRHFAKVLTETEKYLYPQAKELLETLGRHDADIDLMTFGNAEWQRAKVEHSGLAKMFDDVLYAEKDKKEFIRALGKGHDKVIVVNDNGKEMQEMIAEAPEHTYVVKKGPKPIPPELKLPTADTIDEVAAILEKETGWELRREMREAKEGSENHVVRPGEDMRGEIDMGDTGPDKDERKPPPEAGRRESRL